MKLQVACQFSLLERFCPVWVGVCGFARAGRGMNLIGTGGLSRLGLLYRIGARLTRIGGILFSLVIQQSAGRRFRKSLGIQWRNRKQIEFVTDVVLGDD